MSRPKSLALAAAVGITSVLAATIVGNATQSGDRHTPQAQSCPRDAGGGAGHGDGDRPGCGKPQPEKTTEMLAANAQLAMRHQANVPVDSRAFASAVAQSDHLAAQPAFDAAPWRHLGKGPLHADNAAYGQVNGEGFHNLSGRIEDFDYDHTKPARWIAAVANGGVFETTNAGATWHSIGETLPTQITGSLRFVGNRIVVGTGDPAYGGSSFAGLGAFYSDNDGASWQHATGIPGGTITFQVQVDPNNSKIVYQATGKGLYRSTDGGKTYANENLPTKCTDLTDPNCFFANDVTDVVVKPAGGAASSAGDKGGEVMAVVGWRAGTKPNAKGKPQSPQNGLYVSSDGTPGSFTYTAPDAFGGLEHTGRTALGIAAGPKQDHNYLYALVEDPLRFNQQEGTAGLPPLPTDPSGGLVGAVTNPTVLNGVYGSADFGKTWKLLESADQLCLPGGGSALSGTECTLGYAPGVQSWYNEWITPDPSSADANGAPMFLAFGLEEVWGGPGSLSAVGPVTAPATPPNLSTGTGAQAGTSQFSVFGRYFSGSTCAALNLPTMGLCATTITTNGSSPVQGSSTHPDQHAAMFVPQGAAPSPTPGASTLVVGNDGGAYSQTGNTARVSYPYDNDHWGNGINVGLDTLLPYDAEMARDGTVWGGLQDNGELKIEKSGVQNETFGGDGFFSAVDPGHSTTAYEEYTGGDISVTTDGGSNWRDINPSLTGALFATPFVMDPLNANHIGTGGREVKETVKGPKTDMSGVSDGMGDSVGDPTAPSDWVTVFDLGTNKHPGDAAATSSAGDPNNTLSAIDVRGANSYVGFCGYCDIVTGGLPFGSGIATNVGGKAAPKAGTSAGWHIAAAHGLPQRIVNSVTIDPKDPKTVYVTLGGYGRRWIPPGSLGDDTSKIGTGHVFVSHDAGANFIDISGDLPDVAADSAVIHDGDLIVADDLGVYGIPGAHALGAGTKAAHVAPGLHYRAVGTGLPKVPVFTVRISPRNPDEIVAASMGRGVQDIVLSPGSDPVGGTSGVLPGAPSPRHGDAGAGNSGGSGTAEAGRGATGSGALAFTGLAAGIPIVALLLIGGGVLVARRRRADHQDGE